MRHTTPTSVPHRIAVVSFQMHVFSSLCVHTFLTDLFLTNSPHPIQHIAECHNPLAAILRERGGNIVCIDT
jgi:hypothetical protein